MQEIFQRAQRARRLDQAQASSFKRQGPSFKRQAPSATKQTQLKDIKKYESKRRG